MLPRPRGWNEDVDPKSKTVVQRFRIRSKPAQWPCVWMTSESWSHSVCLYLLWVYNTVCFGEGDQSFSVLNEGYKLVDFSPLVQFGFGNYVCIIFSSLTNGVVQVPAQGCIWTHFFFKSVWKIVDSWPCLIHALYICSLYLISKGKEIDASPRYESIM